MADESTSAEKETIMDGPGSPIRLKRQPHIPHIAFGTSLGDFSAISRLPWLRSRRATILRPGQVAALAAGMGLLNPSIARAQPFNCGYGFHPHMWGGGTAGLVGLLFLFILLVAAMALALLLVCRLGGIGPAKAAGPTPLDILKERFARGEIDRQEFEEHRQALGE